MHVHAVYHIKYKISVELHIFNTPHGFPWFEMHYNPTILFSITVSTNIFNCLAMMKQ